MSCFTAQIYRSKQNILLFQCVRYVSRWMTFIMTADRQVKVSHTKKLVRLWNSDVHDSGFCSFVFMKYTIGHVFIDILYNVGNNSIKIILSIFNNNTLWSEDLYNSGWLVTTNHQSQYSKTIATKSIGIDSLSRTGLFCD